MKCIVTFQTVETKCGKLLSKQMDTINGFYQTQTILRNYLLIVIAPHDMNHAIAMRMLLK